MIIYETLRADDQENYYSYIEDGDYDEGFDYAYARGFQDAAHNAAMGMTPAQLQIVANLRLSDCFSEEEE